MHKLSKHNNLSNEQKKKEQMKRGMRNTLSKCKQRHRVPRQINAGTSRPDRRHPWKDKRTSKGQQQQKNNTNIQKTKLKDKKEIGREKGMSLGRRPRTQAQEAEVHVERNSFFKPSDGFVRSASRETRPHLCTRDGTQPHTGWPPHL